MVRKRQMRRWAASVSRFNVFQKVVRGSGGRDTQFARSREPVADKGGELVLLLGVVSAAEGATGCISLQ